MQPSTLDPQTLLHELQVHQIELEMQNEAIRQAQALIEESRDQYFDLYEFAPVGYLTLTTDGLIIQSNLGASTLFDVDRARLSDRLFSRLVVPEDRDMWNARFVETVRNGGNHSIRARLIRGDGLSFPASLQCLLSGSVGNSKTVRVAISDVSDQEKADEQFRIAAVAFETQEGIFLTAPDGVILKVNRAFTKMTGYSSEEAIGQTPRLLSSGRHDQDFYRAIYKTLADRGYWQGEIWNRRKNGDIYPEWLTISAVTSSAGRCTHYVAAFSDITSDKEASAEIERLAYFDALTGLPNRRLMRDRLLQAMANSRRAGTFLAVIFLDLDNFKTLNDTRGHDLGDELLVEVSERLTSNMRQGDTVARLGGDEFVIVLIDLVSDEKEAAIQTMLAAEKIRRALADPYELRGADFHCSASLGVALYRGEEENADALLKHADVAMYQAKSAGRNTFRFFDPAMQDALDERAALENSLRVATKLDQFQLYYQPQLDDGGRVTGAEALLRWNHPEHGIVSPGAFIPIAESSDLILQIGSWVIQSACEQLKGWSLDPWTSHLVLSINVSARQFRHPTFVSNFMTVVEESGVNPKLIKIELTESVVLDCSEETICRMQALREQGVLFSLDDFGTGFSSLSYLLRLPLDQLKIDQSFIRDLETNATNDAIVRTVIQMGQAIGLNVIAEGVETAGQQQKLEGYGCTSYQGYLYSRPIDANAFMNFVRDRPNSR